MTEWQAAQLAAQRKSTCIKPGCGALIRWVPGSGWRHDVGDRSDYDHTAGASQEAIAAMQPAYARESDLYNAL